jgi:hypothetical protein
LWILIIGFVDLWIVIDDIALIIGSVVDVVPMFGPPAGAPAPAGGEGNALSLTSTVFARSVPRICAARFEGTPD